MDSLRSFMDEMLNDQGRKEGFISDLLGNLKNQPIPTLEQAQQMALLKEIYENHIKRNVP